MMTVTTMTMLIVLVPMTVVETVLLRMMKELTMTTMVVAMIMAMTAHATIYEHTLETYYDDVGNEDE